LNADRNGDRVLLITGGSSGIGASTARHAVAAGYRVSLIARSAEKLDRIAAECESGRVLPIVCDVRSLEEQEAAVVATLDAFGRVDAAYANAGLAGPPGDFLTHPAELWRDILDVTLYGAALTIRTCLPALEEAENGHLLICGSSAGRTYAYPSLYSAAKWGLTSLGYGLQAKLAPRGVRVTLIEPGVTETPFFETAGTSLEEIQGLSGIEQPLAADDVARAVLFALEQPPHVAINELLIRPSTQAG
jgi:NADP-dependent 3-hydroxy acid dehydrogenase YdfG